MAGADAEGRGAAQAGVLVLALLGNGLAACGPADTERAVPAAAAPPNALALLSARFTGARVWLAEVGGAEVTEGAASCRLRETLRPPGVMGHVARGRRWRSPRRSLTADWHADGRLTVTSARGGQVEVRRADELHARPGEGHLALQDEAGALVGALFASPRGLEEVVVADESLRYELDTPAGWTLHQPEGRHELVELRDGHGRPALRLSARWAFDEAGARWPLRVTVDGDAIVVQLPEGRGPLLVDPEWQDVGTPSLPRFKSTVTTLADGKVLLVGGENDPTGSAGELFDPWTGTFEQLGKAQLLTVGTATLLPDGRVLLAGSRRESLGRSALAAPLEIYRPDTRAFAPLAAERASLAHTATRLADGTVLLAGGLQDFIVPPSNVTVAMHDVSRFDPADDTLTAVGSLLEARGSHRATLLADGDVLLTGGEQDGAVALASVERYDPGTHQSALMTDLATPRKLHTALLIPQLGGAGRLLLAGGPSENQDVSLYDVATGLTTPVGAFPQGAGDLFAGLLPTGEAIVVGGYFGEPGTVNGTTLRLDAEAELLDVLPPPPGPHHETTGTLLPGGEVLVFAEHAWRLSLQEPVAVTYADALAAPVGWPTVTTLSTGEALITEGGDATLFDPRAGTFTTLPDLLPRIGSRSRATNLFDGRVLVTGGLKDPGYATEAAALFDPRTRSVSELGMLQARADHAQTLLPNGQVLIVGGVEGVSGLAVALVGELFDPSSGSFTAVETKFLGLAPDPAPQQGTAVVMPDGDVWVIARSPQSYSPSWTYDIEAQELTSGYGSEPVPPTFTTATRAGDGRLLGVDDFGATFLLGPGPEPTVTEVAPALWTTPALSGPTLVALPTGRILMVRAADPRVYLIDPRRAGELDAVQLIDEPLAARRPGAVALLPDGGVLLAGALAGGASSRDVSVWYEVETHPGWLPTLDAPDGGPLRVGEPRMLSGAGLLGVSEGTSSTRHSPSHAPTAFLLLDGGGMVRGTSAQWSATEMSWRPDAGLVATTGILFASTMGLTAGVPAAIERAADGAACLGDSGCRSGHCADGRCCDTACDVPCFACSAAVKGEGSDGVCEVVVSGTEDARCEPRSVSTCGRTGRCDGAGTCTSYPDQTVCDDDRICQGGQCVERACDGDHTILRAGAATDCSPYRCRQDTDVCLTACDSNLDCVDGQRCDAAGRCGTPPAPAEQLGCAPCRVLGATPGGTQGAQPRVPGAALAWLLALAAAWRRRWRRRRSRRAAATAGSTEEAP